MRRKKAKPSVKEDVTCNLIPMVDIMFLLLLFFILGADMTQREQADLILPVASEVKEDEKVKSADATTTVNVQHADVTPACALHAGGSICRQPEHWVIVIRGAVVPRETLRDELKAAADEALEPDVDPIAGVRLSARKVIIRADQSAPYGDVNKIIEICGTVGIYKIEVSAAVPPQA